MSAIINFFKAVANGLIAIVEFLGSMIADILYVVQLTGEFVSQIPQYLSFIPAPVLTIILSMFAVAVVYKILGRE